MRISLVATILECALLGGCGSILGIHDHELAPDATFDGASLGDATGDTSESADGQGEEDAASSDSGRACVPSVCKEAGTVCQDGATVATCAQDANGCFHIASTDGCTSPRPFCSGMAPTAVCSASCSNTCTQGQASCSMGQIAYCALGTNGCWAYGAPGSCPSTRQACTGAAGSAVCQCGADTVCSAAGNACASPTTQATCAMDTQGCFYETSTMPCGASTTCYAGSCTGVCGPGQLSCIGGTPQTCGTKGQWVVARRVAGQPRTAAIASALPRRRAAPPGAKG
jgi:hypothetical protein